MKIDADLVSAKSSFVEEFAKSEFDFTFEAGNFAAMLRTGVRLAQEGNRAEARHLLLRVAEAEPQNETAWLWLASISEYPEELLIFLQNVLKINPQNERAVEWKKATKSLLAKTFVQRGIEACQENRADFGKQCFLHALGQDQESEMAWLWLASVTEAVEEKTIHLQKVLSLNPDNETAQSSLKSLKDQKIQSLLRKANSAAIAGEHATAQILLEEVMNESPDVEEAWILKAYLATNFFEKIKCYEQVLQINPANEAAQAGMSALQLLMEKSESQSDFGKKPTGDSEINEISPQNDFAESQEIAADATISHETNLENPAEISVGFTENHQTEDFPAENRIFEADTTDRPAEPTYLEESPHFAQNVSAEDPTTEGTAVSEDYLIDDTQIPNSENYLIDDAQILGLETLVAETSPVQPSPFSSEEHALPNQQTFSETGNQSQNAPESIFEQPVAALPESDFEILETIADEQNAPGEKDEIEFSLDSEESESFVIEEEDVPSLEEYSFSEDQSKNGFSDDSLSPILAITDEISTEQEIAPQTEYRFGFPEKPEEENKFETPRGIEETAEFLPAYEASADNAYFADYNQPTVEFSDNESPSANIESFSPKPFSEDFGTTNTVTDTTGNIAFESFTEKDNFSFFAAQTAELPESPTYTAVPADEYVSDFSAPKSETKNFEEAAAECPYCGFNNNLHTVVCVSCRTILSLSDLEMLLAYQDADNLLLEKAIERIEEEKTARDLTASELQILGIAHLNAKNLRKGLNSLQEASKLTPNDVVLSSKVNFLAIRLSEIELQESKNLESFPVSRTIMVVDDSPTVRKLISGKLEKSGHLVVTAVDGIDAMSKIAETIPDLVLLDIAMPQMDGYQVCKLIRNNEATKDVPVVMISGKDGFFDKVRGKMVGSTGYITKPFGPETLMKAVENYIN